MTLRKLFEPAKIGALSIRNKIVMPPMYTGYCDESGLVTDQLVDYYAARAKGGAGLIIVESTSVAPGGRILKYIPRIDGDDCMPGLSRLAKAINKWGARSAIQIVHAGRKGRPEYNKGLQPVAPSPVALWRQGVPRELTIEEIDGLVESFAEAAERAREAGFHAVELHAAHHLIHNFLSPLTNKRTDRYGGDLESRMRFLIEIFRRIRQKVGDYPLIVRISGDDYTKGSITMKDAQQIARALAEVGFDAIDILAGYAASSEEGYIAQLMPSGAAPMSFPRGCFTHLGEAIKSQVKVPVILCGRINEPCLAERILEDGKADLIAIGRGLIADPEFPNKASEGRYGEIRKCIACRTCLVTVYKSPPLACSVNAEAGKEASYTLRPAQRKKKVLVVGAGPAGMEAARVAALRGHEVTLCESKYRLGGNLIPASAVSFKREIKEFLYYLSDQLIRSGVLVRLGTAVNARVIEAIRPDVVIAATGAKPILPRIPGINKETVTTAGAVLDDSSETGSNPIVVGGGMIGCEVAAFLAEKGRKVTLVSRRNTDFSESGGLAQDMESFLRKWLLFELWPQLDINVIGNCTFKEVTDAGLIVSDRESRDRLIEGNSIVFAAGLSPNKLSRKLASKESEWYEIGDCVQPRQIIDAIAEGAATARKI